MKKIKHILLLLLTLTFLTESIVANASSIVKVDSTVTGNLPTVTTKPMTQITANSARCGGNVLTDGGEVVTARGVCWSTSQNPTLADSHTDNGGDMGSFVSNITGLSPEETYYVRAYATNSAGTAYGEEQSFTTNCFPRVTWDTVRISPTQLPFTYGDTLLGTDMHDSAAYSFHYLTMHNCDSTSNVAFVFSSVHVTACNKYLWAATGDTYFTSGTYFHSFTDSKGHPRTDTLFLTIHTPTVAVASMPPVTVCENQSLSFAASATGNGNIAVNWSGPANFSSASSEVSVSSADPGMSGVYTVTATATEGGCTATASSAISVTVNPLPEVHISGEAIICKNESVTLTASGAESYQWSTGSLSASITETPATTQTFSVVGTDENNCQNSASVLVTVNQLPDIIVSGDGHICEGEIAQLTASGAKTYVWSTGSTNKTIEVTPTVTTTYTVEGTDENDCSNNASFTVNINDGTEDDVYVTACEVYYWPVAQQAYTVGGTYTHVYTNESGCISTHILHLTLTHNETHETSVTKCGSYTWNGMTYTESGTYNYTYFTPEGCEITEVLHLTINHGSNTDVFKEGCDIFRWETNDELYTTSGTYPFEHTGPNGCPCTTTLHLTIHESQHDEVSVTSSKPYLWRIDGNTYAESGDYVYEYTDDNGCNSTITLHLTIQTEEPGGITGPCIEARVKQHESCDGDDGIAYLFIPPLIADEYDIEWTLKDGSHPTTVEVSGLSKGTYTVKAKSKRCSTLVYTKTVTIKKEEGCDIELKIAGPTYIPYSCNNLPTAAFHAYATGGTPPYTYVGWNGNSKVLTLPEGVSIISCTVKDSKGRSASASLKVTTKKMDCSQDPNEIAGPLGYDDSVRYVNATDKMNYTINFENDPDFATAPASRVKITYDVPDNQNIASFRLADFGFGNHIFTVPSNISAYSQRLDVSDSLGVWVDVTAGIDIMSHQLFWIFQSIDPATGFEPSSSQMGFLPINDSLEHGEGYVNFYILPDGDVQTGDTVAAEALIVFDDNEPIGTNVWRNTFDAVAPTSTLHAEMAAQDSLYCTFTFTAQDDQGGSGVRSVETFVSVNNGGYTSIGSCHPDSTLTYALENGLYYQFMSLATDNVGNTEPSKSMADTAVNYNVAPFDLLLDGTVFYENVPLSTYIGTFFTLDDDIDQQFVYELVNGEGSADNGMFKIVNNELRTNSVFECSQRTDYTIRVKSTDIGGLSIERAFAISEVILHNTPTTFLSENICEGESYDFHGQQLSVSGTYTDTLVKSNGCDSIVTLFLTVNPVYHIAFSQEICQGNYYDFNGILLSESGIYTDTLQSVKGCDSIVTLNLTVNPVYHISISQEICQGDSFDFHGVMLTQSGTYTDTLPTLNRCDSIVTLTLTVNPVYNTPLTAAICDGDSYDFFGHTLTTAGTYTDTLQSVNSCDSVITLTLTVNPTYNNEYDLDICEGERLLFDGNIITESGTYVQTIQTVNGCDSITTIVLTVHSIDTTHITAAICDGGSYNFFGQTLTTANTYTHTLQSVLGCDSVIALTLTVNPVYNTPVAATICDGSSYDFFGQPLTTEGTYTHTLQTVNGCDSVIALTLTVNPVYTIPETAAICDGDSYSFFDTTLTTAGTYTHTLQTVNGCDSVIALTLTVNPVYNTPISAAICDGGSYSFFDTTLTTAGTYTHTLQTVNGCDSVIALTLTVNPVYTTPISAAICNGGSYNFFDTTLTTSGTYSHTLPSVNGCDSTITLSLMVLSTDSTHFSDEACESYTWNNVTYYESGEYMQTFSNTAGCDSIVTLQLVIKNPVHTTASDTACESYTWNEVTYTVSGDYDQTFTAANGCDSVVTLHLTVLYGTHNVETESACESFTWHGTTYTTSGIYTYEYDNTDGCASADTLHLTVNHGTHNVETETVCGNFTWHGTTYDTSGTYMYAYINASGCASADTLHLTVLSPTAELVEATACESYMWNGTTYTVSGDYEQTFTAANGCDSVVTLHLTVLYGTHNVETETACESFTWHGTTYTTSGIYTYEYDNADGCASADTLHLTVNHGTHNVDTETACETFTWHGQTYTESGTYVYSYTNTGGCVSADTLHLTILSTVTEEVEATACDSYTWNGTTYTTSGEYMQTFSGANGCDSVVTLNLTIHYSTVTDFEITTADSCYEWNTQVYCETGDYVQTLQTADGCDSVVTLHLTITVGIDNHDLSGIEVFPNPTNHLLNIKGEGMRRIDLYNADGQLVYTKENDGSNLVQVDVTRFAAGQYFVKVRLGDGRTATRKVVVSRR